MRTNPFLDTFRWLTDFRWETLLFLALLLVSLVFLRMNWRADASQRTPGHVALWAMRVLIGGMWYQGSTWKLPLPSPKRLLTGFGKAESMPPSLF